MEEIDGGNHGSKLASIHAREDKKFLLRIDVVECWHLMKTHENLRPWRWFVRTLPETFTVSDLQTELIRRPQSLHSDRARALIDLISRA